MKMKRRTAAGLLAVLGCLSVESAQAATPVDRELRAALAAGPPGGRLTGPHEISWAEQGVTLTVAARKREPVNYRTCRRLEVCLWQDRDATGRRIAFKKYGTYKLRRFGMAGGGKGAGSYYNHQCCGARATLIGPNFRYALSTWGNVPRAMNDRATYVRLFP